MHLAEILAAHVSARLPGGRARGAAERPAARATSARRRTTIRAKRLRRPELPDWEALREAGAAIKARAMATLPEQLERLEAAVTRAGGSALGARRRPRRTRSSPRSPQAHGAREVIKVKSLATDEIDLNEALAGARDRGDRDRPGRADHPARRRQAVAHPRAGDPPQPRGDQGAVRAHDRARAGPRLGGDGDRRGRAPAPAREVPDGAGRRVGRELRRSPRPARWASSSPRATGACARRCPRC